MTDWEGLTCIGTFDSMRPIRTVTPKSIDTRVDVEAAPPSTTLALAAASRIPKQQKPSLQRLSNPSFQIIHRRIHSTTLTTLPRRNQIPIPLIQPHNRRRFVSRRRTPDPPLRHRFLKRR